MPRSFLRELKRRKVYRVAVVYAIVGWLLIQIATQVFPFFHIPDWTVRVLVLLVLAGFPIALVLAWAFDATPHGIARTETQGQPVLRRSRRGTIAVGAIGVAIAVIVGLGYWTWHREPAPQTAATSNTARATGTAAGNVPVTTVTSVPASAKTATAAVVPPTVSAQSIPAKSVAVLPFENLSTDKANAYFADGMQDLILTKLADIGDLKVISRTSTMQYGSHPENLKLVGQQLGVAAILEGSVQKAGNQVLINVQLIDAQTDNHLWAKSYTRTLDNIFGVEGEVADKVAKALNAKLSPSESAAIAKVPTRNKEAYQAYLKAIYYLDDSNRTDDAGELAKSITLTKQAVAADPNFADAWSLLALGYQKIGNHNHDAENAARRALSIAPDNASAHGEYALALTSRRAFKAAIAQAQEAVRLKPNAGYIRDALGFVYLGAGDLDKAGAAFARAVQVNPRINFSRKWVANIAMRRRDYTSARDKFQYVAANDPADVDAATTLADVCELGWGDLDAARKVLQNVPTPIPSSGALADAWHWLDLYGGDYPAALKVIQQAPASWFQQQSYPLALYQAQVYRAQGDDKRAKQAFAQARAALEAGIKKTPEVAALHASLSLALAGLGDGKDAVMEAQHAAKLADVFSANQYLLNLAKVEAWTGQTGAAVKSLDGLLGKPAGDVISVGLLKLDPTWDSIRHDPRFQALLTRYAKYKPPVTYNNPPTSGITPAASSGS